MSSIEPINSPSTRRLIAIIVFSFLVTFVLSRLTVYLVLGHWLPNLFLTVRGVHIHHFIYGVVILVVDTLYLILKHPKPGSRTFRYCTLIYGVGLGLTFDEFGMWVRLEDEYWMRQSYDAIIVVTLLLINIALYPVLKSIITREARWLPRFIKRKTDKSK
ncbi:MAG: hypothetical protein Q7S24_01850 [bacterium]|nr:hypothetical protein [bacterium]